MIKYRRLMAKLTIKFAQGILLTIAFMCSTLSLQAQDVSKLQKAVMEVKEERGMKHASLSVAVYDMKKKSSLFSYEASRSLMPASLVKLFTTAAGFDRLGGDFRFRTCLVVTGEVSADGVLRGDVVIVGGGDPLLGSYRYRQTHPDTLYAAWCTALRKAGVNEVQGRVCYDASVFDKQPLCDNWVWGDIGNYYASGVSGLNFHENMYFVYFTPGTKVGYPATVASTSPTGLSILHQNEVMTGPENSGDGVIVYGDPHSSVRTYRGTVPLGRNRFAIRAGLPNPGLVCAERFATYLIEHGVKVSKSSAERILKKGEGRVLSEYYSIPYYMIAQYANLTSNNMYAECILKYLGHQAKSVGSYEAGVSAVENFMKGSGLDMGGVRLVDGSGLSRCDAATADFVCRFLCSLRAKPYYTDFVATLGRAGESGTVASLLKKLPQGIEVRMKSGSMSGVCAFAGVVTNKSGDERCFAVICNNFDGAPSQIKTRLEKILYSIAQL